MYARDVKAKGTRRRIVPIRLFLNGQKKKNEILVFFFFEIWGVNKTTTATFPNHITVYIYICVIFYFFYVTLFFVLHEMIPSKP